jgi:hypothetical protein
MPQDAKPRFSWAGLPPLPTKPLIPTSAIQRGDIAFDPRVNDFVSTPTKYQRQLVFTPAKATQVSGSGRRMHAFRRLDARVRVAVQIPSPARDGGRQPWSFRTPQRPGRSRLGIASAAPRDGRGQHPAVDPAMPILFSLPDDIGLKNGGGPSDVEAGGETEDTGTEDPEEPEESNDAESAAATASAAAGLVQYTSAVQRRHSGGRRRARPTPLRPSMYLPQDRVRVALEKSPEKRHAKDLAALEAELSRLSVFAFQPEAFRKALCRLVQLEEYYSAGGVCVCVCVCACVRVCVKVCGCV